MIFSQLKMKGIKLTVELPCDNKGAVNLVNNWSIGGRACHIGIKQNYLRELKKLGYIQVLRKPGENGIPDTGI